MDKASRIKTIFDSPETGEQKSINYKGDKILPVKKIPLDALLYNPYNGRIRSSIISYESSKNKQIDNELETDKLIIEQYLFDSASNKNEKTIESLIEKGQQEIGIVTKDGVIIDGNRRALLLNIINRRNKTNFPFKAIVLNDELQGHEKDIMLLETSYQMGVDSKVDYNPIEKYLRCRELNTKHKLSTADIAAIMSESSKKIEEWLSILDLMDNYLERMNTPEIYTRLEKREGHFVDLNNYLKAYSNRKSYAVKWDYVDSDVLDMKNVYFDYVRLAIPVQRARVIAKPSSSNSFFCQENIWSEFISEHKNIFKNHIEPDFKSLKKNKPDKNNEDIVREIDDKWKEMFENQLMENLSYSEVALKDFTDLHTPVKILKRILNNLGQINVDNLKTAPTNDAKKLLTQISLAINELLNHISK